MGELPEEILYQGVSVDIAFGDLRPGFSDLFLICGDFHTRFPPSGAFGFERLADLQFKQVDDFFGVRSLNDEGDDVPVWLYPLVDGEPVYHHHGPFEGVRLEYNVLRNPLHRAEHFLRCVQEFATLGLATMYRGAALGTPPDLSPVRADIEAIASYWASQDIAVGSSEAMQVDY